jgi:ubiquinol-cytochrome c reductase cytochrome c subunit
MRRLVLLALLALVALPASTAAAAGGQVTQGKSLYGRYCLACHGPNGSGVASTAKGRIGAGPLRQQARQRGYAPSLRGVGALAADFYLQTGYMPLQRVGIQPRRSRLELSRGEIAALTAYVASLGAGPGIPSPQPSRGNVSEGLHLFTDHCAGCHQVVAEGGYVTGAVPPPLEEATPTQVAEAVRIGPYVMPRFSEKAITNRQLDSLIAYVQYAKHPDDRGGWAIGHIGPVPEGLVTWLIGAAALVLLCMIIGKRLHGGEAG